MSLLDFSACITVLPSAQWGDGHKTEVLKFLKVLNFLEVSSHCPSGCAGSGGATARHLGHWYLGCSPQLSFSAPLSHLALYIFIPSNMTLFSHIFKAPDRGRGGRSRAVSLGRLAPSVLLASASCPEGWKRSRSGREPPRCAPLLK